jgi:anti-sigma B factor antagonist
MIFSRDHDGDRTTLHISGTLDALTAPDLRPTIEDIAAGGYREVLVDLSDLELIDSSGVAVIVSLFKRMNARGGTLRVTGARNQPLAIFKLLRMDRVFSL